MRKYGFLGAVLFFAFACFGCSASQGPQNIVLIGWDGAQRNHVKELIKTGELPNLAALGKEGRIVDIDVTNGRTDTKAGWTQILTGYRWETTGVFSNLIYQPVPEGYSVFERLEKFFGPDNIDTVALIGKKGHVDNDAPRKTEYDTWLAGEQKQKKIDRKAPGFGNLQGGKIVEENGKKYIEVPGKPWYVASQHMDLFENGLKENEVVVRRAIEELEKRKDHRFFFFIHFGEPDHLGHTYGENSQQYSDGLKSDDESTGKIIAKLKALGLYERTLVYVTADHGFDEGLKGHSYAPYVFLATNDPKVNRDGDRMDVTPTILKRFGLDLSKIEPELEGTPLDEPAERKIAPAENPYPKRNLTKPERQEQKPVERKKKKQEPVLTK
jgi:hypothetical protein